MTKQNTTETKKSNGGFYFLAILLKIFAIAGCLAGVAMLILHIIEIISGCIDIAKYVTLIACAICVVEGILLLVVSCMSIKSKTLKSPTVANIILAICIAVFAIILIVIRFTQANDEAKWSVGMWILSLFLMAMTVGPQPYILKSFYWR